MNETFVIAEQTFHVVSLVVGFILGLLFA